MAAMEDVAVASPSGADLTAALALPAGSGPHAAVIVIHEIFGLNADIRDKARRLAGMGYVAIAPDLLGPLGPKPLCMVRAFRDLRAGKGATFENLEACRTWLAGRPEVDASRIGVIGFCLGGGFALLLATRGEFGVAGVFYGDVPKDITRLEGSCPVVAGYGGKDRLFRDHAPRLEAHLAGLGVPHDVKRYEDAGHSYMSRHRGVAARLNSWGPLRVGFNPAAAEDSWARIASFFGEHLGPGPRD